MDASTGFARKPAFNSASVFSFVVSRKRLCRSWGTVPSESAVIRISPTVNE